MLAFQSSVAEGRRRESEVVVVVVVDISVGRVVNGWLWEMGSHAGIGLFGFRFSIDCASNWSLPGKMGLQLYG